MPCPAGVPEPRTAGNPQRPASGLWPLPLHHPDSGGRLWRGDHTHTDLPNLVSLREALGVAKRKCIHVNFMVDRSGLALADVLYIMIAISLFSTLDVVFRFPEH